MAQPRGTTLQQRFGFQDDDLKTASHDEIMLWTEQNLKGIINALFWKSEWQRGDKKYITDKISRAASNTSEELKKVLSRAESWKLAGQTMGLQSPPSYYHTPTDDVERQQKARLDELVEQIETRAKAEANEKVEVYTQEFRSLHLIWPQRPEFDHTDVQWEYAIMGSKQFIIGFIDLRTIIMYPVLRLEGVIEEGTAYNPEARWRIPDLAKLRIISGGYTEGDDLFVEVKSTLSSAGELLRQIKMYQQYVHGEWLVVCPDSRYKDILNSQDIHFWQYPIAPIEVAR